MFFCEIEKEGGMKILLPAGTLLVLTIMAGGCTGITEHEITLEAGLTVLSPSDYEVVYNGGGFANARCMMSVSEYLFVLSSDGLLYRMDTETYSDNAEFIVGQASASGYGSMVYSSSENTFYAVGAYGKVIELDFPECQVLDEIAVGVTPVELVVTKGSPGYLWVADAAGNCIYQMQLDNNHVYTSQIYPLEFTLLCMEATKWDDSLLVGTSSKVARLEAISPGVIRNTFMGDLDPLVHIAELETVPYDSNFVGISTQNQIGVLCAYDRTAYPDPPERFYNRVSIEGSMFTLETAGDNLNTYALGYIGEGISRLYLYSSMNADLAVLADLPGYPLDLTVTASGDICVLTYQ